jgi:hypothetical protein
MKKVKKMNMGGLPTQAAPQAAVGMANRPAMPAQAGNPTMPAQANMGGGMRGLDRAAAMSGRPMPTPGRPVGMKKGGVTRADGCVTKGHTKGKMVKMAKGGAC